MKSLTFHIKCGGWSAVLQLPASASLESLAAAIIDAAGFDFDHAFGFYDNLKNPYRSTEEYTAFADMGEDAKEGDTGVVKTKVSSVFTTGKKMLFLFDYGDDWMFRVTCKGEGEGSAFKSAKTLSTSGIPPVQYPDEEE